MRAGGASASKCQARVQWTIDGQGGGDEGAEARGEVSNELSCVAKVINKEK
jgi:hypothetical protein